MSGPHEYLLAQPRPTVEYLTLPEVPAAVVKATDYPMADLPALFDASYTGMFPGLAERGISPVGPAYSLHHRMPGETVDIEVGIPIDRPLEPGFEIGDGRSVVPSSIPAGEAASVSATGAYDGLGEAWQRFMTDVSGAGRTPGLPFWEVYVTEPGPDVDPATLRTDLFTTLG